MKKCFVCQRLKPLSEYYTHKMMSDGHINKCKDCCKSQAKDRHYELSENPEWVIKERARGREKAQRLYKGIKQSPEVKRVACQNYKNNYPEKYAAAIAVNRIKVEQGYHKHHWSYNEEHYKDVIIISAKDHALIHRYMKYDKGSKMFHTYSGNLLNTKQKHLDFIMLFFNVDNFN